MGLLQKLGAGQAYLKMGLLGFQGSGKTFTATLVAIGLRKHFKLTGPIAMFDTEGGSEFVAPMVRKGTGADLLGFKGRSLSDLLTFVDECIKEGIALAIVDSVTHIWREVCDAYLKDVNDKRRQWAERDNKSFKPKTSLEFQDWAHVKAIWARWSDLYLNSPLHIIICGRAGFEYEMQVNEDTQKKELVKTGIKMRTESEFGYEPSLLVEMEREQIPDGEGGFRHLRRATVIKDRYNVIDGKTAVNPTFDFFKPHIELLRPASYSPIDMAVKTETGADVEGNGEWEREKKTRAILLGEIQGLLVEYIPGQAAADKQRKVKLLHQCFGERGWEAMESMNSKKLREGLEKLKAVLVEQPKAEAK